jgi:hypothetical protein
MNITKLRKTIIFGVSILFLILQFIVGLISLGYKNNNEQSENDIGSVILLITYIICTLSIVFILFLNYKNYFENVAIINIVTSIIIMCDFIFVVIGFINYFNLEGIYYDCFKAVIIINFIGIILYSVFMAINNFKKETIVYHEGIGYGTIVYT